MGVVGLEKFIHGTNIFEEIDIRREIAKWQREHGSNPTIIIDVRELTKRIFRIDEVGLILGGRYPNFNDILDYFFRELKKTDAKLFFILRLTDRRYKNVNIFEPISPANDNIIQNNFLDFQGDGTLRPTQRILYNIVSLIRKYGHLETYYVAGKSALLKYARENRDSVMALITRNTDFLVLDGEFEYWSLSEVKFFELKIGRFCRQKMNEELGLNVSQMQLLQAISKLEVKIKDNLVGFRGSRNRIPRLATYVKDQHYGPNGYEPSQLTGDLTEDQREIVGYELAYLLMVNATNEKSDDELILDLMNHDESFNSVFQFCKKNIYFAYKLMMETSTTQRDLLFIDIRRRDALPFIDLVINLTMKMCGVIFKDIEADKQPNTRTVQINRTVEDNRAVDTEVDIIYPTMPLPSVKDLIIEEEDKSLDESRWSLFEWLLDLDEESIAKINRSTKNMRIVLFTLEFLLSHQIITRTEADILLLTEFDMRSKGNVYVPRHFCPPPPMPNMRYPNYVDMSWVQAVHKYTISFEHVCHCLELCGLRNETEIIGIDGCKFHENMNQFENGHDDEQIKRMLAPIKDIRLWQ